MTTLLLIGIAFVVALVGLPWALEALFGRRIGVWFGLVETIAIAGLFPYWLYQWNVSCKPGAVEIIGNAAYDNDPTCRALILGLPILFVVAIVTILLLIPSTIMLFLESRRRSKGV